MEIFNIIGKKANEAYKTTTQFTQKMSKELKLKSALSKNKDEVDEIYNKIGKNIYEKHVLSEDIDYDFIKVECNKIDSLATEIEDIRMEILELNNKKQCKNCSYEIVLKYNYCPNCGADQNDIKGEVKYEVSDTESKESESNN